MEEIILPGEECFFEGNCTICGRFRLVREITPEDKGLEEHISGLICTTCIEKEIK